MSAVDEHEVHNSQGWNQLREQLRRVALMEVDRDSQVPEALQLLTHGLHRRRWLRDFPGQECLVGSLEEINAVIGNLVRRAVPQGGPNHQLGVLAVPDADLQDRPEPVPDYLI